MDWHEARSLLQGCYVTIPTMFHDSDLSVDSETIRRHVSFLVDAGIQNSTGVVLAGGAAGDFTTLTFDERVAVAADVVEAAAARVPVAMGAQTTSTRELVELAHAAQEIGAAFIQVSPPFYFNHTEDDIYEVVCAAADAADVGIIVYNTYWTSRGISDSLIERLVEIPNVIGLKWSTLDNGFMEFERVVTTFADRFSIIDNQLRFVTSHMLGARAIETHVCNYWPEWGLRIWKYLEQHQYEEAQRELVDVAMPFMVLWKEIEHYTGGDGHLDKLCMELVGLGSSRGRPPTRDIRHHYRDAANEMLANAGVPRLVEYDRGG